MKTAVDELKARAKERCLGAESFAQLLASFRAAKPDMAEFWLKSAILADNAFNNVKRDLVNENRSES